MIIDYGFSIRGKSHVSCNTSCQDYHKIIKIDDKIYIIAAADGVGSAENSAIGAKMAVESACKVCKKQMPPERNTTNLKALVLTAFNYALKQIMELSIKMGKAIESFDTTLMLVIYDNGYIVYGHSGDGGVIGLNSFGEYMEITKPQKGNDGISVIPLRFGSSTWVIEAYEEELAAVAITTDGMRDIFFPYLLRDANTGKAKVYVPLVSFFMDPAGFEIRSPDKTSRISMIKKFIEADKEYKKQEFYDSLEKIYDIRLGNNVGDCIKIIQENNCPISLIKNVTDDKTIVAIINCDIKVENKKKDFFQDPNWKKLKEEWNRKAYPQMYKDKK